jgi:glycosyltransferase involved in cell wall biosynthesis
MYKRMKVAVVVPAYNEAKLIKITINTLPDCVDYIIAVNDASKDKTLTILKELAKKNKLLVILDNEKNGGIGFSLMRGYKYALEKTDADAIGIVAGDAQCNPDYIEPMLKEFVEHNYDYIKANRFFDRTAFKNMPTYRQIGNIFISLLTKFATGYYSVSDVTNGFGFFRRSILEKVNFDFVENRYDYETSMLIALSIAGAKVKDHPVPAIYGEEKSTINFMSTARRNLRAVWVGFWRRIYYKYILLSFHPIALFLLMGIALVLIGVGFAVFIVLKKILDNATPSTGTVMLSVLPIILGMQLLLTAITMDITNERNS